MNDNNLNPNQPINNENNDIFNNNQQNTNVNPVSTTPNVDMNNNQNQYTENVQYNNPTNYKLILTRKKSFVGFAGSFSIYVDNELVGKIKNGKTLEVDITPGNHTISVNKANAVNINVTGNVTADVVVFGTNDFGITNINGQGSSIQNEAMNRKVANANTKSNADLVMSILQPILAILLIFILKVSPWIVILYSAFSIGYIIIDIAGIKNLKDYLKEKYKPCLIKKIVALVISILCVIPLIYLNVNEINSFDDLKEKFNKNKTSEKNNIDDDIDENDEVDYEQVQLGELKVKIPYNFYLYDKDSNYIVYMTEKEDCSATILTTPASNFENESAMIKSMVTGAEKESNYKTDNYNIIQTSINGDKWNKLETKFTKGSSSIKETFYAIKKGDNYYAMNLQNLESNSSCNLYLISVSLSAQF